MFLCFFVLYLIFECVCCTVLMSGMKVALRWLMVLGEISCSKIVIFWMRYLFSFLFDVLG